MAKFGEYSLSNSDTNGKHNKLVEHLNVFLNTASLQDLIVTKAVIEAILIGVITSHSHSELTTKTGIEAVLTGLITSHSHNELTTKAGIEAVLTGLITSHGHNYPDLVLRTSVTHDFVSIAAGASDNVAIAVTGVLTTDIVIISNGAIAYPEIEQVGYCTSTTQIAVQINNHSAAAIDLPSLIYNVMVLR